MLVTRVQLGVPLIFWGIAKPVVQPPHACQGTAFGLVRIPVKDPVRIVEGLADLVELGGLIVGGKLRDLEIRPRVLASVGLRRPGEARRGIDVRPGVGGRAKPVVLPEGDEAGQAEVSRTIATGYGQAVATVVAHRELEASRGPLPVLLLEHDVDDAAGPVGLVLRGGRGDHLNSLNGISRQLG